MTNETTASQPNSIGDDAQFLELTRKYDWSIREMHGYVDAFSNLITYIDNFRAPAAQASATIQAAPNLSDAYLSEAFHRHGFLPENLTGQEKFYSAIREIVATIKPAQVQPESRIVVLLKAACDMLKQGELTATSFYDEAECDGHCLLEDVEIALDDLAAATQEPVMVAELVGRIKQLELLVDAYGPKSLQYDIEHPNDGLNSSVPAEVESTQRGRAAPMVAAPVAYADPKAFENFSAGTATNEWMWAKPDAGLVPLYRAAPMVADSAGVAVEQWHQSKYKMLEDYIAKLETNLAATVKAVPSEALEAAVKACEQVQARVIESNGGEAHYDDWSTMDEGIYAGAGYCIGKINALQIAAPLADKTGGGE